MTISTNESYLTLSGYFTNADLVLFGNRLFASVFDQELSSKSFAIPLGNVLTGHRYLPHRLIDLLPHYFRARLHLSKDATKPGQSLGKEKQIFLRKDTHFPYPKTKEYLAVSTDQMLTISSSSTTKTPGVNGRFNNARPALAGPRNSVPVSSFNQKTTSHQGLSNQCTVK